MNWFIVESTMDKDARRYSLNADWMIVHGELVGFYVKSQSQPTRVLRLEPGQIVFQADARQALHIEESITKAEAAMPQGAVQ